jgi:hypothetical protein
MGDRESTGCQNFLRVGLCVIVIACAYCAWDGREFGMNITVAMGTALVRSLQPSPSGAPRPRTLRPLSICALAIRTIRPHWYR